MTTPSDDSVPPFQKPTGQSGSDRGATAADGSSHRGRVGTAVRVLVPLGALALAALTASWLLSTKPRAKRRPAVRNAALVEVIRAQVLPREPAVVEAMGTVAPAQEVEIHPRVRGEVVSIAPSALPGGILQKGEVILRIDASDYRLAVKRAESEVVQAQANLRVEHGNQSIARKEFEMLGQEIGPDDRDLVLRRPHLDSARAVVEMAQAALARAQLDLERTTIRSPFNAVVLTRHVGVGTRITETNKLVTLVDTDRYWINVAIPTDEIGWIALPSQIGGGASAVRIFDRDAWGSEAKRHGRVLRLAPNLEGEGLMAKLLVEVDDPMALTPEHVNQPRLLIGSYVRVEIVGAEIEESIVLNRDLVRDGNTVWIMAADDTLDIRPVEIALLRRDRVYLSGGINDGDRIVVTDLPTPVQGMALRTNRVDSSADSTAQENGSTPTPAQPGPAQPKAETSP